MDHPTFSRDIPSGSSPNSLDFVVQDETVKLNRMKDERLPTGGYVTVNVSAKNAISARGSFTGFEGGDVEAHKEVNLALYLSFAYDLNLDTATKDDFLRHFHYFYTIVSDPTHTRDHTGGCMILKDEPERVKSGNRTYWMPGKDRGRNQDMDVDNLLIHFEDWKDGLLTGWCFDPADHEGTKMGGGTCDVKVSFSIRFEE